MPIQILELAIKATVENRKQQLSPALKIIREEELIEECARRVLKRLEEQKER